MGIATNARITTSVINAYMRNRIEPIFRKDVLMAMLKSKGRLTFNAHGAKLDWKPKFRRQDIVPGDGNPVSISFPQMNKRKVAQLEWVNYNLGASWNKYEELISQNKETALFKIAEDVVKDMADDFMESFRLKLYTDSSVAANSRDLSGLETMFAVNGVIASGTVGSPNDTYAGLSTVLGNYGGDWTADTGKAWPTGTGSPEYCFWSPIVVDYTNSGWAATTKTWPNTWQEALNYAVTYGEQLQRQSFDLILLNSELLRQAKDSLIGKQTLEVTQNSELVKLGHKTIQFNGIEMASEYGVPSGVGYLLSFDKMELLSLQGQLVGKMDDSDITTAQQLRAMDFYGQLKFEAPSYFAKVAAIS